MRIFYIRLIDHGVVHGCVNFDMAKQVLNLFDGHAFIYGTCRQCSSEFMRMDFI